MNIDSYHVTQTYGGCLEGPPDVEKMLSIMKNRAVRLFGERKTKILDYTVTANGNYSMLPRWTQITWLDGPALGSGDGGQLVVINFTNSPDYESVVDKIDWALDAEDFEY